MGGVCCAGDPNAERGSWNAEHHGKPRGAARPCIAVPRSAFALPRSMKFPDRLPIPEEVLKIAQRLESAGYETWCVGGAIRDNLLELENHDFDLTTAAPPAEVRKLFKRTVPVGIEHGTVAVLDRHNRPHEVTTFRRDIKTDGRHAVAQLSAARVRDEWFKGIATARHVSKLLQLWVDVGAARIWLPEIREKGDGTREKGGLDKLPRDPVLITAYLATDPASLLTRLKCSNKEIERGRAIGAWRDKYPDPKHLPAVRRWLSQVGEYADDLLTLPPARSSPISLLPKVVASIRAAKDPLTLQDLAVDGNDLIAAGVRPGPDVGEALERLLGEVLEDPSRNTKQYLLAHVYRPGVRA